MGDARSQSQGIRTIYYLEREFIQIWGRPREFNESLQSLLNELSSWVLSSGMPAHILVLVCLHIQSTDTLKPKIEDSGDTGWRSCTGIIPARKH